MHMLQTIDFFFMQTKLGQENEDELRCQWHKADHNKLSEISAGLLVSTNHLVEKVKTSLHHISLYNCWYHKCTLEQSTPVSGWLSG